MSKSGSGCSRQQQQQHTSVGSGKQREKKSPTGKGKVLKRSGRPLMLTLTGLRGCRRPVRGSRAGVRALGVVPTGSYIEKACLSRRSGADEGACRLESPPTPPPPPVPLTPPGQSPELPPPVKVPPAPTWAPRSALFSVCIRVIYKDGGASPGVTHTHKHKDQRKHNSCSVDGYIMLGLTKLGCSDGQEV